MNEWTILKQYVITKYFRKFRTKRELEKFQNEKIENHLKYIAEKSNYFKKRLTTENPKMDDWRKLPTMDKSIMMENFEDLNTVGIRKEQAYTIAIQSEKTRDFSPKIDNISVGLSSGTSGNRGIFLVSDEESAVWAGTILAKVLPDPLYKKQKIAFFLRANNNLYKSTQNSRISFNFFDLLDEFEVHIQKLNTLKPSIIVGPPSILRKVAEWQSEGKVEISPKRIISVAEVLEDIDKYYIESVFKQTLHQIYQSTEGFLASTCSAGTLHVNEDLVVIEKEYMDEEAGAFVPIITDFSRASQPIIKYRLNDILVEKVNGCSCGSPFMALERIDGRCDDLFYGLLREGEGTKEILPDFIRRAIMFSSDDILEFKVTQKTINSIEVKLRIKANKEAVEHRVIKELTKVWENYKLIPPKIHITEYDIVPSDIKLKRIQNDMKKF